MTKSQEGHPNILIVLPLNEFIRLKIFRVRTCVWIFGEHPTQVRVEKTFADRIRIFVAIDFAMVAAVIGAPLENRTLEAAGADRGKTCKDGGRMPSAKVKGYSPKAQHLSQTKSCRYGMKLAGQFSQVVLVLMNCTRKRSGGGPCISHG